MKQINLGQALSFTLFSFHQVFNDVFRKYSNESTQNIYNFLL